jgi:hypothetical protein
MTAPLSTEAINPAIAEAKWRQERAGKISGSRFHDLLRETRSGGYAESRQNYIADLGIERLNGEPLPEGYVSPAMQWGRNMEDEALDTYALYNEDGPITRLGKVWIPHPSIGWAGCSPDALVGEHGAVSVKCPISKTHMKFLDNEKIEPEYLTQIHWELACTGRRWCDFVSFDPRPKLPRMQICIKRVMRDASEIGRLENEARKVLLEIEQRVHSYQRRFG